jgi:hypothetical protein
MRRKTACIQTNTNNTTFAIILREENANSDAMASSNPNKLD